MIPLAPTGWMLACTDAGRRAAKVIADRLHATLHGEENLPRNTGALLVGNHAYLGVDSVALSAVLLAQTNTLPRFLADRNLFRVPGLRSLLTTLGAISGNPDDAIEMLKAGELVAVYPGGVDDSFKLSSEAYQLKWHGRAGFARVAMRAGVPIVPIAATGVDELYRIDRHEHLVGRRIGGSARYDLPLPKSLVPRRVPLDFYVLPPIDTKGDPNDEHDVERVRHETEAALQSILDPYRKKLAHIAET